MLVTISKPKTPWSHRIRWDIVPDRGMIPLTSFPDEISPHEIGTIRRQPRRIPP
jgi:hypothetical protein